ncbi:MAG: hypothetical protein ABIV47_20060 [Roseiflexaceae bacterium]
MARRRTPNDERRTPNVRLLTNDERRTTNATLLIWLAFVGRWSFVFGLALMLSGCMLTSGERPSMDALADGGNVSSTFVGATGNAERTVETGANGATMNAIVIVQAERGELRLELLNPDGNVAFSVQARPDEQVTRRGDVLTDEQGRLRYRVIAQGARNGGYQVLYQRAGQ